MLCIHVCVFFRCTTNKKSKSAASQSSSGLHTGQSIHDSGIADMDVASTATPDSWKHASPLERAEERQNKRCHCISSLLCCCSRMCGCVLFCT